MAVNERRGIWTIYYFEQDDGTYKNDGLQDYKDFIEIDSTAEPNYTAFDNYQLWEEHPSTYNTPFIVSANNNPSFKLYYKQYRRIQVGDNLSGKILHCSFPKKDTTVEWWMTKLGGDSNPEIITTTNGSISAYSEGTNHTAEEIFVRYPKSTSAGAVYTTLFSQWSWNVMDSLSTYQLPSDFGTVTNVINDSQEASSNVLEIPGVWNLVKIYPVSEPIWLKDSIKIYLGEQPILSIFCGENEIVRKVRYGNIGHFTLEGASYSFILGQTWKTWIEQQTSSSFSTDARYALYNNKIIVESSTSNLVYHSNKIIDDGEYGLYQDQGVACLSEKVKIKTSQKDKNISALKVGDYLSGNNKVEKIVKHNRNYYYRIILNNNDVIEASNDHRFILLNKEIKTTEQLKTNDYLTNDLYIKEIRKINQSLDMYEIKTSTNKYELYNGIICECENI